MSDDDELEDPGDPRRRAYAESTQEMRRHLAEDPQSSAGLPQRPRTRGDCANGPRPCPYVSCRHNLYLDVLPDSGHIRINHPGLEPGDLRESCSLDIADRGGATLEEVGDALNLTRERARQIETKGLLTLRRLTRRRSSALHVPAEAPVPNLAAAQQL